MMCSVTTILLLGMATLITGHDDGYGLPLTYGYPRKICNTCSKPDWELLFKAVAGVASSTETDKFIIDPYQVWNRNAPYNADNEAARRLDTTFQGHYKSRSATNWQKRNIQEVKVALLDANGKELISLIYDGRGTTRTNWWTTTRLLQSPWSDILTETRNVCGAVGDNNNKRRFYTNRNYNGCNNHAGWIAMITKPSPHCQWERDRGNRPQFLYSKQRTYSIWNNANNIGSASIFTISVRSKCLY